jgi:flagellar biosynthesis/type III secretory pathway protein FliH
VPSSISRHHKTLRPLAREILKQVVDIANKMARTIVGATRQLETALPFETTRRIALAIVEDKTSNKLPTPSQGTFRR